jgi:dipeptidase D
MSKPSLYPKDPAHLWEHFYQITRCPRPSRQEAAARNYVLRVAEQEKVKTFEDEAGNIILKVPGTKGMEKAPTLILQNHLDMVCDKALGKTINFQTDPIDLKVEGDWLRACDTTLGADNGIGCAAALALLTDKTVAHPPLEILFTVDEETGLHGANNLDITNLSGEYMINLDTEEWGSLYIGCAGGIDYQFEGTFKLEVAGAKKQYKLSVGGLKGGHSGIDIHLGRGNALKILNQVLLLAGNEKLSFDLLELRGGRAHNIIPRDAFAIIGIESSDLEKWNKVIKDCAAKLLSFLPEEDSKLEINLAPATGQFTKQLISSEKTRFLNLLSLFPHGAYSYNWQSSGVLVNHSSNFAQVLLVDGQLFVQKSVRYTELNEASELELKLNCLAREFDIKMKMEVGYPSWRPNFNDKFLAQVKNVYKEIHGTEPHVKAIHAGLECGIIKEKLAQKTPDLKIVSMGPTITNAHSPTEGVFVPSVTQFWQLLVKVIGNFK